MTDKLLLEKDGALGWIIFNQPEKRNAVSQEMWELMPDYVHDLATDDAIRVVVLRGAGDQAFVAGADISQFKEIQDSENVAAAVGLACRPLHPDGAEAALVKAFGGRDTAHTAAAWRAHLERLGSA